MGFKVLRADLLVLAQQNPCVALQVIYMWISGFALCLTHVV